MIESTGPTNTRFFRVAVYFRGERLATGTGNCIQDAEMNAATLALQQNQSKLSNILKISKIGKRVGINTPNYSLESFVIKNNSLKNSNIEEADFDKSTVDRLISGTNII